MSEKNAPEPLSPAKQPVSTIEGGMIMMATAVMMAPGVHAIAKGLGGTLSPGQIAFSRFLIQFLLMLPVVWISCRGRIPPPTMAHALRGFLMATASVLFFWALTRMPLAESSAIFFVEPLILTLMSALFLGEQIGPRRILAVIIGFAGAMIVIRPNFQVVGPTALLPLMSALCVAIYLTITRRLADREDARVMQFWVSLFAALTVLLAIFAGLQWPTKILEAAWPSNVQLAILVGLGAISTVANMLANYGIRRAPAGILAPLQYLEILGATFLGALFFSDLPDVQTVLGIIIIVGSGLYVFRRERRIVRQANATAHKRDPQ